MNQITVSKLDADGRLVWDYSAVVLERGAHCVKLEAYFQYGDRDLGYVTFAMGDRFVEYHYGDRWYNIFAVHDGDSATLKGWYCNICRPALLNADGVSSEDLALDMWMSPGGEPLVLDSDEFEQLSLTAEERRNGLEALDHLLALARSGRLPH